MQAYKGMRLEVLRRIHSIMAHRLRVSLGSDSWDLSLDLWDFCNSDALSAVVFGKGALSFQRAARETACAMDAGLPGLAVHALCIFPAKPIWSLVGRSFNGV